jgi:predicted TIM-barrel fold metal-dependent hydrolase
MGIATGRFVVDTHTHAQRHAVKWRERGTQPNYNALAANMHESETYDNSPRLLYDMGRYGVDMCVIQPAFSWTDEVNAQIVEANPDRFVALVGATTHLRAVRSGEIEWSIEEACRELDQKLATGKFVGIGETMPSNPKPDMNKIPDWEKRFEEICQVMEVARKYQVPVGYHTGTASQYAGNRRPIGRPFSERENPLFAHDIAALYRDVPIIMMHGGQDGWWSEMYMEATLQVAAAHPNVYLETGNWWPELYERPLRDPNIGAEKLIWGTDWGAAHPVQWWPGGHPTTYMDQSRRDGIPAHMPDIMGWSLRQLDKLEIPQDDLNLILGGNAAKLFKLKVPHTRLFKEYLR